MSIISPLNPLELSGSGLYPDVLDIAFRRGATRIEEVAVIKRWLMTVLTPHIDGIAATIADEVNEALVTQADAVNAHVEDVLAQVIASSITVSDPVIKGVLQTLTSQSTQFLDDRYLTNHYSGFVLGDHQAFATGANVLERNGKYRTLHFSIINDFDVEPGSGILPVPFADKPAAPVMGSGTVKLPNETNKQVATYQVIPNGAGDGELVLAAGTGGTGNVHEGTVSWSL